jgi:hypothetical protein
MRAAAAIGSEKHRVAAKISSGCASSLLCIVSVLIVLQLVSEVVMQAKQNWKQRRGGSDPNPNASARYMQHTGMILSGFARVVKYMYKYGRTLYGSYFNAVLLRLVTERHRWPWLTLLSGPPNGKKSH